MARAPKSRTPPDRTARAPADVEDARPDRELEELAASSDDPASVDSATEVAIDEIAAIPGRAAHVEHAPLDGVQDRQADSDVAESEDPSPPDLEHDRIARESETIDVDAPPVTARPTEPPKRPRDRDIAERAYEYYERRGRMPGHEVDDWLAAERELLDMGIELEEES